MGEQLRLPIEKPKRGGFREGAGRKPIPGLRRRVPHRTREAHKARHPVHVTLRARAGLPSFRDTSLCEVLFECFRKASRSPSVGDGFRVVHFSVQPDHVHLIVEASDTSALSRGVQGLEVRLARAINGCFGDIQGQVWADRYHARALKTPREVRNAIVYVLMNAKKHVRYFRAAIDVLSSAPWFDGIRGNEVVDGPSPVMLARTWLGNFGWRKRGLIAPHEKPS
jgi:REP element-mobilizing transposase RayT